MENVVNGEIKNIKQMSELAKMMCIFLKRGKVQHKFFSCTLSDGMRLIIIAFSRYERTHPNFV